GPGSSRVSSPRERWAGLTAPSRRGPPPGEITAAPSTRYDEFPATPSNVSSRGKDLAAAAAALPAMLCAMALPFALFAAVALLAGPAAAPVASPPAGLAELARLRHDTHAGRFEALQGILRERGVPFEVERFDGPKGEGHDLVATFGAGGREIVVGAHYDAVKLKDGTLSQGMVDDGAGVIALLRLAEALRGRPLRHWVRVAFFDQEEIGLLGSKAFVAARQPAEVAADVNVDIDAYGDTLVFGGGKGEENAPLDR